MKKLSSLLLLSLLLLSFICCSASASLDPYIGADVQVRHMPFKLNYGHNQFEKTVLGSDLYAGLRITPNFGIEIGYDKAPKQSRETSLQAGSIFTSNKTVPTDISPLIVKTKERLSGPYLGLMGFYPITETLPLELVGSAGISFLKLRLEREVTCGGPYAFYVQRAYSSHKNVPRIGGGIQYGLTEKLTSRAMVHFTQTSKLKACSVEGLCSAFMDEVKPKDTIHVGLGLNWEF